MNNSSSSISASPSPSSVLPPTVLSTSPLVQRVPWVVDIEGVLILNVGIFGSHQLLIGLEGQPMLQPVVYMTFVYHGIHCSGAYTVNTDHTIHDIVTITFSC